MLLIECDYETGERTYVRALTGTDRARIFWNDPELRRFARLLAEAHALVLSAAVPRPVRRDLAAIVDALDALLHGTAHYRAS